MIEKSRKLKRLRRQYKAKNIFFYDPEDFFEKIDILRGRIVCYHELITGIKLLEKNISLLQGLYKITEDIEQLIYKFTADDILDVGTQDELFGEHADSIADILPLLTTEDVGLFMTGTDDKLDELLEDFQEKVNAHVEGIQKVANDLSHMLTRSL